MNGARPSVAAMDPGFYGKLPCRGDFVGRQLSRDFIDVWDRWLQEGLEAARHRLGEDWLEYYLASPVWRFLLDPGIAGPAPVIGVLMPSVDQVGRYFPLTVATELPAEYRVVDLAALADPWCEQAETAVLSALEEDSDFETFAEVVEDLDRPMLPAPTSGGADQAGWWLRVEDDANLSRAVGAVISHGLGRAETKRSLWWTRGSEQIEPAVAVTSNLPAPQNMLAFLDGAWKDRGWGDAIRPRGAP